MKIVAVIPSARAFESPESGVLPPAEHLRELAWECRQLAAAILDEAARRDLTSVAEGFERLARVRARERAHPRGSG